MKPPVPIPQPLAILLTMPDAVIIQQALQTAAEHKEMPAGLSAYLRSLADDVMGQARDAEPVERVIEVWVPQDRDVVQVVNTGFAMARNGGLWFNPLHARSLTDDQIIEGVHVGRFVRLIALT